MKRTSFIDCKIKDIIRETDDSVSILLDIPAEHKQVFDYSAGQYLTLRKTLENEEIRRSYSLSSAPHQKKWRIGVKKVQGGKMSTFLNNDIEAGNHIEVMPPMGNFTIEKSGGQHNYVFFGAGSGITPILSMIIHLLETTSSHVTLFFGNKGVEKIMYREELEGLKNRFMDRFEIFHIFSKERLGSPLFTGRINGKKCKEFHELLIDKESVEQYFICGPSTMIFDVESALLELGVPKDRIKYELFTTADIPDARKVKTKSDEVEIKDDRISKAKIKLDGIISEIDIPYGGIPILEAADDYGMDVPYSCKGGVCSTCKARLLEGEVKMDVNYALEEDEIEQGFILTCQSHPLTEKIYVDYDQS